MNEEVRITFERETGLYSVYIEAPGKATWVTFTSRARMFSYLRFVFAEAERKAKVKAR